MPVDRYAPAHDSWIQLALFPKKAFFIDRVLQVYRQHSKNELGWAKKMTPEELLEREKQAIADNFRYLQHLPQNTTLAFWKRMFFFIVYYLKLVRKGVRKLFTQM